jgi:hypothetical protein
VTSKAAASATIVEKLAGTPRVRSESVPAPRA